VGKKHHYGYNSTDANAYSGIAVEEINTKFAKAQIIMTAATGLANILKQVEDWPVEDQIILAQQLMHRARSRSLRSNRGRSAEEVIELLNIQQPAPDDAECEQIVEEELMRKYGR